MTPEIEAKGLAAVQHLDMELTVPQGLTASQLCVKYAQVKPTLEAAVAFLAYFPFIGKGAFAAIRFLMLIADQACPAPTPAPTPAHAGHKEHH
jgi:hypothetical protein